MQPVSDRWKEIQQQRLLPESFIEIEYTVTEPNVWEGATTTLQNAHADTGVVFISNEEADTYGLFQNNPIITYEWEEIHPSFLPGFTLTWYNGYAVEFKITVYQTTTIVQQVHIKNNLDNPTIVQIPYGDYTKIEIELIQWGASGYATLQEILLGIVRKYNKENILSFSHKQEIDILSGKLPNYSITFELDNTSGIWNPDNPVSETKYLIEQQKIVVRYGMMVDGNIEWIPAGTMYLSEWDTPSNGLGVTFTAKGIISLLNNPYTGQRYGALSFLLASAILQDLSEDTVYRLDSSLYNYSGTLPDDQTISCAQVIQLCANAAGCSINLPRDGSIIVAPIEINPVDYVIDQFHSYIHPEITLSVPLLGININNSKYTMSVGREGSVETVNNILINNSTQANNLMEWMRKWLSRRKSISGEYRADVSLDAGDFIRLENKYSRESLVTLTEVEYKFTGSFHGKFSGRIVDQNTENGYADEIYSMAVGDIIFTREE